VTHILAISGSLRKLSHNTGLLRAAAEQAPEGITIELYDGLASLPAFNEDHESDPGPAVEDLRRRVRAADALLFSTPEYNTTMPGHVKQLVDWTSRPYGGEAAMFGKPVLVVGASKTAYGAIWAQDHLRKALGLAGARVSDFELPIGDADGKFDETGKLTDQETIDQIEKAVTTLVDHHQATVKA
jgi:chromate reductase